MPSTAFQLEQRKKHETVAPYAHCNSENLVIEKTAHYPPGLRPPASIEKAQISFGNCETCAQERLMKRAAKATFVILANKTPQKSKENARARGSLSKQNGLSL